MRRQLFALTFVALPLAAALSRRQSTASAARIEAVAGAPARGSRPVSRSTRWIARSIPAPTSTSSPAAAGSRRTRCRPIGDRTGASPSAGSQLHGPAPHSRNARRARATARRRRTTTPRAWTSRASRRAASTPIAPDLADHRRDPQPGRSAGARRAPARLRRAGALPLRRADRSRGRDRRRSRTSIRPASACPIATTT